MTERPYEIDHLDEVGTDLYLDAYNFRSREHPTIEEALDLVRQAELTLYALKAVHALEDPQAKDVEDANVKLIAHSLAIVGHALP